MGATRQPTFSDLLRRFRAASGLTQEELAERASLSAHGIADLEAGRRRSPRKDTVALLAEALRLSDAERQSFEAAAHRRFPTAPTDPISSTQRDGAARVGRLIGRARETTLIERQLAGDGPALLVFAGEPGIGKSRLLREAGALAAAQGWEVLSGGCHRRSGQEPFAPLLTTLERSLSSQPPAHQRLRLQGCGWLARLLPELADTGVLSETPRPLPPEHERRLMFAAVGRYLANVAGPSGTLLLLDDLQWAATDALDLLAALLRTPPAAPLRILAAYRDTEMRKLDPLAVLLADLGHEELARRVTLEPLSMADALLLLEDLLPDEDAPNTGGAPADFKQQLIVRAGGAPYFLISCAQAVADGVLAETDITTTIPTTVAETIRQRVGALPESAQAALSVAAIIGRVAPRALLLHVLANADQPEALALASLEVACDAHLLIDEEETRAYQFAHDLVREVVSADLSAGRRALLHRQVAEALERESGGAHVEQLAYHYAQSEDAEKAILYLERAGDQAHARYALAEAIGYYRSLIQRLDALGRARDAALAREKLGAALVIMAHFDDAMEVLEAAVATHRGARDDERTLTTAAQIGWIYSLRAAPGDGIAYLTPFVELSTVAQASPRGTAALYTALAHLHYLGGQYREQLPYAERAVESARAAQDDHLLCQAAFEHGTALLFHGRFSEALVALEDAMPLAEAIGDPWTLCWILSSTSTIYHFRGQWDIERGYITRALELAERLSDPPMMTLMTFRLATVAQMRGAWAEALDELERCLRIQGASQPSWITPYPLYLLGELRLAMGNPAEALRQFDESIALASRSGDLSPQRFAQAALAEYDLLEGRPESARARLEPLLDRPGQQEGQALSLLPTLAWAYLDLGDEARSDALVAQTVERAAAMGGYFTLVDALRVRGMRWMRRGEWAEAMAALDESLRVARAMPHPYGEAKTLYVYGLLHLQRGEQAQARERHTEALALLHRLGERLYAERVEQVMRTPARPRRSAN